MLGTYFSAALICASSLLVGRAILAAVGRERWSWLEPAVGFAALLAVPGLLVRLPGGDVIATVALAAMVVASVVALRLPYELPARPQPGLGVGIGVSAAVLLALSIPFAVSGHWGLIGVGLNNDLGLHLAWAEELRSGFGPEPEGGYPLGPHGLAIAVAAFPSTALGQAFLGEVIAIGILTGLTALGALGGLGPGRRVLAATLVAITYLAASYFAQSAFKETAQALFVLAFAIALPDLWPLPPERRERLRALAPFGVLAAGIAFAYSFAGLAWPVAIVALWSLTFPEVRQALSPRRMLEFLRAHLPWVGAVLVLGLLLAFVGPFGFASTFGEVAGSNTYGPVSPFEALGVWPAANYRLDAPGGTPYAGIAAAIGVAALIAGLIWWMRRGERAVPIALGACALLYVLSLPFSGDYSRAKALMIAAPLAMLISVRAMLGGPGTGWRARSKGGRVARYAYAALATLFVGGAIYSSFLVLRDTPVGPPGHLSELNAFRSETGGRAVLYAGQDRFAAYALLGSDTSVPLVEFPDERVVEGPGKPFDTGNAYSPIDFDSFTYFTLNQFRYVITSAAAWTSAQPSNFREIARTDSFVLWEREGPTGRGQRTLLEGTEAAAFVNCVSPEMAILVDTPGRATVFAEPGAVIGPRSAWDNDSVIEPGEETSQELLLPAGTWRLSIQYFSPVDLTLSAPGFEEPLVAALDGQRPNTISLGNDGQYWPAGEITVDSDGQVPFTISAEEPTRLQELTGWDAQAYVGQLVAVPAGPRENIRLPTACGRWIDHYRAPRILLGTKGDPVPPAGATGATGATGPTGATGATGATGTTEP